MLEEKLRVRPLEGKGWLSIGPVARDGMLKLRVLEEGAKEYSLQVFGRIAPLGPVIVMGASESCRRCCSLGRAKGEGEREERNSSSKGRVVKEFILRNGLAERSRELVDVDARGKVTFGRIGTELAPNERAELMGREKADMVMYGELLLVLAGGRSY